MKTKARDQARKDNGVVLIFAATRARAALQERLTKHARTMACISHMTKLFSRAWSRVPVVPSVHTLLTTLELHHCLCVPGQGFFPCRFGARSCKNKHYTNVLAHLSRVAAAPSVSTRLPELEIHHCTCVLGQRFHTRVVLPERRGLVSG